jgi:hypothetical protein
MSLQEKSLLISLTLAGIPSSRADKEITAAVLSDHNARADAGRWLSRLWPREAMEPIRGLDGQIRAYHYTKTLPWMDKGERIIASRTFTPYMETMRDFRYKRETLVQGFIDRFGEWMDLAREMRGDAFKLQEYPSRESARDRFRFEIASAPVPHSDDFRVSLASEDMDEVRADLTARIASAQENATRDIYRRMAMPVAALVERLADPESRFTAASLNVLRDLVATLPDINFTDDPEVEHLRSLISAQLCGLDPDSIGESRSDRSRALSKANAILDKMAPWMNPVEDESEEEPADAAA